MDFSFLSNFFTGGEVIGVDVGTASIKMVEVSGSEGKMEVKNYGILENYGHFDRLNDVIQTSTMKIFEKDAAELVKLLYKEMKTKIRNVAVSLPVFSSFTALIEMPDISDKEVAKTISFKAKQYIPLPIEEVTLDWLPVGFRNDRERRLKQILIVSVPTEQIRKFKEIFKEAGLNLVALEVESLSNVRSLIGSDPTPTVIADIGSHSTGIIIAQDGFLKSSAQIDYAGSHLTHALSKGLNINLRRAEELKKQRGLLGTGGEFELSTIMFPFVDVIINEVVRVKEVYEKNYGVKVERMILTGGGANLLGLTQYAEKQTKMTVFKGDPFLNFSYNSALQPAVQSLGCSLSVALGLAMRTL